MIAILIWESVALLLFIIAAVFLRGAGGALLAGWNTMSERERSNYLSERGITEKEMLRSAGRAMLALAIVQAVSGLMFFDQNHLGIWLVVYIGIFSGILAVFIWRANRRPK
jgi:hypothetical protein